MVGTYKKHKRDHSRDRHRDYRRRSRSKTRSRSPSVDYRRRRSSSRTRRDDRRYRSRTRSPVDRSRDIKKDSRLLPTVYTNVRVEDKSGTDNLTKEEREMRRMMGFCTFDTTKGKRVEGNNVGEVHFIVKRKYRQYMNRKGGFNRPLDFVA